MVVIVNILCFLHRTSAEIWERFYEVNKVFARLTDHILLPLKDNLPCQLHIAELRILYDDDTLTASLCSTAPAKHL